MLDQGVAQGFFGGVLCAIVLGGSAQGETPPEVSTFWSASPGESRVVSGEVFERGKLIRKTRSVYTSQGMTDCGGSPCLAYRLEINRLGPGDYTGESALTFFQAVDSNSSCFWGIRFDGRDMERLPCDFIDLVSPIVPGTSWQFTAVLPVTNHQFKTRLVQHFRAEIVDVDLPLEVGGTKISGCIRVHFSSKAEAENVITCTDGSKSQVDIEIEQDRWMCPGVGIVKEQTTETHTKANTESEPCSEFEANYVVIELLTKGETVQTRSQREFKFEAQRAPNPLVARDRNPRERGFRPVNSDR